MDRFALAAGGIAGALGVVLGAFAAHALRDRLGPQMSTVFETGVRYQMIHALALLAVALLEGRAPGSSLLASSAALFTAGIVLFSGSLYLMTLTGARWLGAITPLGGVALIGGWVCLVIAALSARSPSLRP